jgi:hypothetical protein
MQECKVGELKAVGKSAQNLDSSRSSPIQKISQFKKCTHPITSTTTTISVHQNHQPGPSHNPSQHSQHNVNTPQDRLA